MMLPPPPALGLPAKFESWRNGQDRAVCDALDSRKRVVVHCAPTGFGKTITYMAEAMLSGSRTAFLTASKGLQAQLISDFAEAGLVDIRGQANYPCRELETGGAFRGEGLTSGTGCDSGLCHVGANCKYRYYGCHYFDAFRAAVGARLMVTNYSYWILQQRYGESLGTFDLLVLDEAHDAPDQLAAAIEIHLDETELRNTLATEPLPRTENWQDWAAWANRELPKGSACQWQLENEIADYRSHDERPPRKLLRRLYRVRGQVQRLADLAAIDEPWIVERGESSARLGPVWPGPYAEKYLFLKIPKVVLVSATVKEKTLELLGLKRDEFDFFEYPSSFPVERRPVIHIPTVRCKHDWTETDQKTWVARIDQIIDRRLDRKGIVHTTSYARQQLVRRYSAHAGIMLFNNGSNTRLVVEEFKRAAPPAVLVSPSLTTGWDLPFEACEFAVIGKIPFPDTRSRITKARTEQDPDYGPYSAMVTIVQAAGRGMRSAEDSCEILVVDDMWIWFWSKFKHFAPRWFQNAVRRVVTVPNPLPKLKKETIYG